MYVYIVDVYVCIIYIMSLAIQVDTKSNSDNMESDFGMDFCQQLYDSESTSTDEGYYSTIRCAVNSKVESLQEQLQLTEEGENEQYDIQLEIWYKIRLQGDC